MDQLAWMVGDWEGTSWISLPSGDRGQSSSHEHVELRLNGAIALIEGTHRRLASPGDTRTDITLQALAIVSYDNDTQRYRFISHTASDDFGVFDGEVRDGVFMWFMHPSNGPQIRHSISHPDDDTWFEIGESSNDGIAWVQTFEMTLHRK